MGLLRIATAEQIHRSLFAATAATTKPCQRRLQRLWLHSYLDRVFTPVVFVDGKQTRGATQPYYVLTVKGLRLLNESKASASLRTDVPSLSLIDHCRDINEFRTVIAAAIRKRLGPEARLAWISETMLRKRNERARKNNPSLRHARYLVLPDGLVSFVLPTGDRQFFFLEIDRGTESLWRLVQRAKAYVRLHRTDLKRTIHGVPHFRVLIVTKSFDRLMNMRARIAGIGECLNMFWFATFDEQAQRADKPVSNISPERILQPIWHKITDSGLHSLLGGSNRATDPPNAGHSTSTGQTATSNNN